MPGPRGCRNYFRRYRSTHIYSYSLHYSPLINIINSTKLYTSATPTYITPSCSCMRIYISPPPFTIASAQAGPLSVALLSLEQHQSRQGFLLDMMNTKVQQQQQQQQCFVHIMSHSSYTQLIYQLSTHLDIADYLW